MGDRPDRHRPTEDRIDAAPPLGERTCGTRPATDALDRLRHPNAADLAWAAPEALRGEGARRRRRRRRLRVAVFAGTLTSAAAIATAVALVSTSVTPGSPPAGREAARVPVAAGVRAVPIGDGAVQLLAVGTPVPAELGATTLVVRGEIGLGLSLTRQLAAHGANALDSPLSAAVALSMLEAGAGGATRQAIASVLGTPAADASAQAAVWRSLQPALADAGPGTTLRLANSLWATRARPLRASFVQILAEDYADAVYQADFADPAAAAAAINHWVAARTAGHITHLVDPGNLLGADAVLADALHFHAPWAVPMTSGSESFVTGQGASLSVPSITTTATGLSISAAGGATTVAVPYAGGRYQALVVEPESGSLTGFLDRLDLATLQDIVAGLTPARVDLTMPRLDLVARTRLDPELSTLGMARAFSPAADFTPMGLGGDQVSAVVQADALEVTRQGTEADAATGEGLQPTAVQVLRRVSIDRPYLFLVRDRTTGMIVMAAAVEDPTAAG
jgi:serine protease inhibitor